MKALQVNALICGLSLLSFLSNAQMNFDFDKACINCDSPTPSSVLDIQSTDKGLLIPRMTSSQRVNISAPADGLMVYDHETGTFWYHDAGVGWTEIASSTRTTDITDADGDTKIQTEAASDEDMIRFDLCGMERWVMKHATLEPRNSGQSIFIGQGAGANDDLTNNHNVAIGFYSMTNNYTGYQNTSVGVESMYNNDLGSKNVVSGFQSMYNNTAGNDNVAMGFRAMYHNNIGSSNTAIGHSAMYANTEGYNNCAVGKDAMRVNTTGIQNAAVGFNSLYTNSTGSNNAAIGHVAMYDNTTGYWNAACGGHSLYNNTTGFGNVAVGYQALYNNTTGNKRTAIGYTANSMGSNYDNNTAIGYGATCTASNQVRIGNASVNSIGGQVGWTTLSDGRFKKDITENVKGLDFLLELRPVNYRIDQDAYNQFLMEAYGYQPEGETFSNDEIRTGFLAQEVEAAAISTGFEFSGLDTPASDGDYYGLRYAEFTVPLIKAAQELNTADQLIINEQESLKNELDATKALIVNMEDTIEKLTNDLKTLHAQMEIMSNK